MTGQPFVRSHDPHDALCCCSECLAEIARRVRSQHNPYAPDGLDPARGFLVGIALSVPAWIVLGVVAWRLGWLR